MQRTGYNFHEWALPYTALPNTLGSKTSGHTNKANTLLPRQPARGDREHQAPIRNGLNAVCRRTLHSSNRAHLLAPTRCKLAPAPQTPQVRRAGKRQRASVLARLRHGCKRRTTNVDSTSIFGLREASPNARFFVPRRLVSLPFQQSISNRLLLPRLKDYPLLLPGSVTLRLFRCTQRFQPKPTSRQ